MRGFSWSFCRVKDETRPPNAGGLGLTIARFGAQVRRAKLEKT